MEPEILLACSQELPVIPGWSQINPAYIIPDYHFKISLNIKVPSMPRSSEWSFSFRFAHQNPLYISRLSRAMPHPCFPLLIFLFYILRNIQLGFPSRRDLYCCSHRIAMLNFQQNSSAENPLNTWRDFEGY